MNDIALVGCALLKPFVIQLASTFEKKGLQTFCPYGTLICFMKYDLQNPDESPSSDETEP